VFSFADDTAIVYTSETRTEAAAKCEISISRNNERIDKLYISGQTVHKSTNWTQMDKMCTV
jgi:hypothetical protein